MTYKTEPASQSLQPSLRTVNLTLFGIVAIAPVGGVTLYGFVAANAQGAVIPAYLLATLCVSLTGLSFAAMAKVAPGAGSVQSYAGHAFGPALGFLGGWAMLLDYVLITSLVVVFGAFYLVGAVAWLPLMPTVAGFALFSFCFALFGVSWSVRADILIAGLQVVMVALIVVLATRLEFRTSPDDLSAAASLWPADATLGNIVAGAATAIIAFLGFDAISTLGEEVAGERVGHAIGTATLSAILLMALTFLFIGWALDGLGGGLVRDPATAGFEIIAERLPALSLPLGLVTGMALGLGVNLATTISASRLMFALARMGALPRPLARIHSRFHTPWVAVAIVCAVVASLAFLALDQVDLLAGLVSFGALTGFLLVNASVIAHHGIALRSRRWLSHWLLPGAGAAVVFYVMTGINPLALKIGVGWLAVGLAIYVLSPARRSGEGRVGDGCGSGTMSPLVVGLDGHRELSAAAPPVEPPPQP